MAELLVQCCKGSFVAGVNGPSLLHHLPETTQVFPEAFIPKPLPVLIIPSLTRNSGQWSETLEDWGSSLAEGNRSLLNTVLYSVCTLTVHVMYLYM